MDQIIALLDPKPRSIQRSLLALLALFASAGTALATVVPRIDFQELTASAARIVHARCVATDAFLEADSGTIWTRNHFVILDTLKGDTVARIVVTEPGGVVGNQGQWVAGAPQFTAGDESVLFLSPTATGKWRVVGWGQGNYRVTRDPLSGEAGVKPDLAGAEVAVPAGTQPESRTASHSQAGAPETLEGLKTRIRSQLARQGAR